MNQTLQQLWPYCYRRPPPPPPFVLAVVTEQLKGGGRRPHFIFRIDVDKKGISIGEGKRNEKSGGGALVEVRNGYREEGCIGLGWHI